MQWNHSIPNFPNEDISVFKKVPNTPNLDTSNLDNCSTVIIMANCTQLVFCLPLKCLIPLHVTVNTSDFQPLCCAATNL